MKGLSLMLLALALVFRAAPICADPPAAAHVAMEANCEGMGNHGAPKSDHDRDNTAPACHACAFPVFDEGPFLAAWAWNAPDVSVSPQRQLADAASKPPTPPPRAAAYSSIQHQFGVKS